MNDQQTQEKVDQVFPTIRVEEPKQYARTPVPAQVNRKPEEFDFFEALKRTIKGARITRLSWETNDVYGQMVVVADQQQLQLFIRGEFHSWTVVPGDIEATDWIELPKE